MAYAKVTVVGAGHVGATTAMLLAMHQACDVVLVDVAEGLAGGKALDMMHARSVERFGPKITGADGYGPTAGSDVVVITAGVPRKPGMTRDELLAVNARIVRSVVEGAVAQSPDAILVCVTNPLDIMTQMAWRVSGFESARVLGMGGVLDSARFAYFIAEATGVDVSEVDAVVVGAHGDAMVPLPRLSTVSGRAVTEMLPPEKVEEVVRRTVFGGAEVVSLLKTGSAYYAPAASVCAQVRAILDDSRATLPACVLLEGQYGLQDVYMSVPAVLGRAGVIEVPEWELSPGELEALRASAAGITEGSAALRAAGG